MAGAGVGVVMAAPQARVEKIRRNKGQALDRSFWQRGVLVCVRELHRRAVGSGDGCIVGSVRLALDKGEPIEVGTIDPRAKLKTLEDAFVIAVP